MSHKSILALLTQPDAQLSLEGLQAALVLASFEHRVAIGFTPQTKHLLEQPAGKLTSMLASLDLYDIPTPWYVPNELLANGKLATDAANGSATTPNESKLNENEPNKNDINKPNQPPAIAYKVATTNNGFDPTAFDHVLYL